MLSDPAHLPILESSISNGLTEDGRWKKMTGNPLFRKYSALLEPRVPVEKFSTLLTVFFSSGTDVPPLVMMTIGRPAHSLKFE